MVNDVDERDRYVVAVKREAAGRGGSRALFDAVRVGDVLEASAPRNTFPLVEDAPSSVLVAGGIGVTPIVCMAARLRALGAAHAVHYAVRERDELAFDIPGAHVHVDAEAGAVLDVASIVAAAPLDTHLYCCGPPPMLAAFEAACRAWPGPAANVHVESFAPAPAPGAPPGPDRSSSSSWPAPAGGSRCRPGIHPRRAAGGRRRRAVVVRAGHLRHLRDRRGRRPSRPPRPAAVGREKAEGATMLICCSRSLDPVLVLDL